MLQLRALGGLALEGLDPALQPKRLALLCHLVLARPRGFHRRDTLLALFWPELDTAHGRQALRQALTALRSVDAGLLTSRGDEEVAVVPGVLTCDVLGFEAALESGELSRALELYAGAFLNGFFLSECPEFERWVTAERAGLQRRAADAGWRLAEQELPRNPAGGVHWARLAAGFEPDDERALQRLIAALDRAGDRAGALREYDAFAGRMREEYGTEPAPETQHLIAGVRRRREPLATSPAPSSLAATGAPPREDHTAAVPFAAAPVRRIGRRPLAYAALALLLLLGGAARMAWHLRAPRPPEQSLAVLPFVNTSGDPANEYLSDGITEDVINALTHITGLRVPARTSSFAFKGKNVDIREIGRQLNVARVVEGSVQRAGTRLRVTVQLINVADGYHVWSERYERQLRDVFKVQDEIVRAIAGAIQVKVARATTVVRRSTENDQAYDAYLRGRYFFNQPTAEATKQAKAYFQRAIALDSGYALAYSGLADAYLQGGAFGYVSRREAYPKAAAAARTAVALDSGLAEAYASLGHVRELYDWDWAGAEQAYRRAMALNPGYAYGHALYGRLLSKALAVKGRVAEGIRETGLALALDPLHAGFNVLHGNALRANGRTGEAIPYLRKAVELLPGWPTAHDKLGMAYLQNGMLGEAATEVARARQLNPGGLQFAADLGYVYARTGRQQAARQILGEIQRRSRDDGFWEALAIIYVGLGDRERGLAAFEQAVDRHDFNNGLDTTPMWDLLLSDPRFGRILSKIGLGS